MPRNLSDSQRRDTLSRTVMNLIATRGLGRKLNVVNTEGQKPLVFALEQELLSEVMQRVESAGGSANTFVGFKSGSVKIVSIRRAIPTDLETAHFGEEPVHSDITIGMFLDVAANYTSGVTARIRLPRHSGDVASVVDLELAGAS